MCGGIKNRRNEGGKGRERKGTDGAREETKEEGRKKGKEGVPGLMTEGQKHAGGCDYGDQKLN